MLLTPPRSLLIGGENKEVPSTMRRFRSVFSYSKHKKQIEVGQGFSLAGDNPKGSPCEKQSIYLWRLL